MMKKRGVYQGWLGHRNLGDEAIFAACVRSLSRIHWTPMPFDEIGGPRFTRAAAQNACLRTVARLLHGGVAVERCSTERPTGCTNIVCCGE
jgi:hypothetical protein